MDPLTLLALANSAVGAIKKGCALYKEYKAVGKEVHDVATDIGKHLSSFFSAHEKVHQQVEEQKKRVVKANSESLNQQALDRVLAQRRLVQMEAELKDLLIYQSPPELGAIWTDFQKMREQIKTEQRLAIEQEEREKAQAEWQRKKLFLDLEDKVLTVVAAVLVVGYLYVLLYLISLERKIRWGF